jgi:chromosome segregation ATPase
VNDETAERYRTKIRELEIALRRNKGRRVAELERELNMLRGNVTSAVAAQARAERQLAEAKRGIEDAIRVLVDQFVLRGRPELGEAVAQAAAVFEEQTNRVFQLEEDLRQARNELHDIARRVGWGQA